MYVLVCICFAIAVLHWPEGVVSFDGTSSQLLFQDAFRNPYSGSYPDPLIATADDEPVWDHVHKVDKNHCSPWVRNTERN